MERIDATDVRRNFAEIADRVRHTGEGLIVQRNGRPLVAIVSVADAERLRAKTVVRRPPLDREAIAALLGRIAALPLLDDRSAEDIIGYDERGLPN